MTINTSSSSSIYSSASYSNMRLQKSSEETTSSAELSEEEKLYDTDGDGVLSTTEKAAYTQAQEAKKAAESLMSGLDSIEKKQQSIQKMFDESSLTRQAVASKAQQTGGSDNKETMKAENHKQADNNQMVLLTQRAIEGYKAQQSTDNEMVSNFRVAV